MKFSPVFESRDPQREKRKKQAFVPGARRLTLPCQDTDPFPLTVAIEEPGPEPDQRRFPAGADFDVVRIPRPIRVQRGKLDPVVPGGDGRIRFAREDRVRTIAKFKNADHMVPQRDDPEKAQPESERLSRLPAKLPVRRRLKVFAL